MLIHSVRNLTIVAALSVAGVLALRTPAVADDGPLLRTFGFLVLSGAEPPDFLSEDSLTITVLPKAAMGGDPSANFTIEFSSDDWHYVDEETGEPFAFAEYKGTRWVMQPAHRSVVGGTVDHGNYFWLEDDLTPGVPPVGAYAFTGTDGTIVGMTSFFIKSCTGDSNCSSADQSAGRYYFPSRQDGLYGAEFIIVTAWFSR